MTRDERIEAVARAIFGASEDRFSERWQDADPMAQDLWRREARAAILATMQSLREPDETMIEAGWSGTVSRHEPNSPQPTWLHMIDTAIKEMTDD